MGMIYCNSELRLLVREIPDPDPYWRACALPRAQDSVAHMSKSQQVVACTGRRCSNGILAAVRRLSEQ